MELIQKVEKRLKDWISIAQFDNKSQKALEIIERATFLKTLGLNYNLINKLLNKLSYCKYNGLIYDKNTDLLEIRCGEYFVNMPPCEVISYLSKHKVSLAARIERLSDEIKRSNI